jgi:hypothetical protein
MEYLNQELTIEKLNQAYIKLIKMVLNRTYETTNQHINSFYLDPSPEEAYSILNRIFAQENQHKQQSGQN